MMQRNPKVPRSVAGTWKGELASQWADPATNRIVPPKTAYIVIRQSASTVKVALMTDESKSTSTVAILNKSDHETWVLDHMYLNKPQLGISRHSPIHHGSGSLEISGNPARRMAGRYWTDRGTKGEFRFDERSAEVSDDYESAEALFP